MLNGVTDFKVIGRGHSWMREGGGGWVLLAVVVNWYWMRARLGTASALSQAACTISWCFTLECVLAGTAASSEMTCTLSALFIFLISRLFHLLIHFGERHVSCPDARLEAASKKNVWLLKHLGPVACSRRCGATGR